MEKEGKNIRKKKKEREKELDLDLSEGLSRYGNSAFLAIFEKCHRRGKKKREKKKEICMRRNIWMEVGRMEEFFWSFILVLLERIAGGDGKDVVTGSIKWEERVSVKALNNVCLNKTLH